MATSEGNTNTLSAARQVLAEPACMVPLRVVAVAALGTFGNRQDLASLAGLSQAPDALLAKAANKAQDQIHKRLAP